MLRVLFTSLWARFAGRRLGILDESVVQFRVWPMDLDINLHMNNGRYLTLMDLGRLDFIVRIGLLPIALRRHWHPVVASEVIRFRVALRPFQKYRLRTRLVAWDEKWLYIDQSFEVGGKVAARALVRGLFVERGTKVPPRRVIEGLGEVIASPPLPAGVEALGRVEETLG
jgi:acyl-CoA thioesterase FadM